MCQNIFSNQLPLPGTILRLVLVQNLASSASVCSLNCMPVTAADTWPLAIGTMRQNMFNYQLPSHGTILRSVLGPEVGQVHFGVLTKVDSSHWHGHLHLAMEPVCQDMFNNQLPPHGAILRLGLGPKLGQFCLGALNEVDPGQWHGHLAFRH